MDPRRGNNDFTDLANWNVGGSTTAPGGGNIALFAAGNHTATGNGAVGQILNLGKTTLTGNIVAQGIGGTRGRRRQRRRAHSHRRRSLNAQQQVIVGGTGQGLLAVAGGALALGGPEQREPGDDLVIGERAAAPARCSTSS